MSNSTSSRSVGNMPAFFEREEAESHDEEPVVEDHPDEFVDYEHEHDEKQNPLVKICKKGHKLFHVKRSEK
ncbi:hypothetical protein A0J61_06014 [Choanephora cucurbitarum]|uniref:Uncharacterized protein n=1 Tax=Choanephora cucurbitarum TaxID=101091 RepID=A0A1C7NF39_9FUNG|nr:hypothetical protein A0J61_06014 [Choanephora cucurbitarum]